VRRVATEQAGALTHGAANQRSSGSMCEWRDWRGQSCFFETCDCGLRKLLGGVATRTPRISTASSSASSDFLPPTTDVATQANK